MYDTQHKYSTEIKSFDLWEWMFSQRFGFDDANNRLAVAACVYNVHLDCNKSERRKMPVL